MHKSLGTADQPPIESAIRALFQTERGSLPHLPEYGTSLNQFRYKRLDSKDLEKIEYEIYRSLSEQEPRIILKNIEVSESDEIDSLIIKIEWRDPIHQDDKCLSLVWQSRWENSRPCSLSTSELESTPRRILDAYMDQLQQSIDRRFEALVHESYLSLANFLGFKKSHAIPAKCLIEVANVSHIDLLKKGHSLELVYPSENFSYVSEKDSLLVPSFFIKKRSLPSQLIYEFSAALTKEVADIQRSIPKASLSFEIKTSSETFLDIQKISLYKDGERLCQGDVEILGLSSSRIALSINVSLMVGVLSLQIVIDSPPEELELTPNVIIISNKVCFDTHNLGSGTGTPAQFFPLVKNQYLVEGYRLETILPQLKTWQEVEGFAFSNQEDCHFVYEAKENGLRIGDGKRGKLIPPGFDNVLLRDGAWCSGARANQRTLPMEIRSSKFEFKALEPPHSGKDPQKLGDLRAVIQQSLLTKNGLRSFRDFSEELHLIDPQLLLDKLVYGDEYLEIYCCLKEEKSERLRIQALPPFIHQKLQEQLSQRSLLPLKVKTSHPLVIAWSLSAKPNIFSKKELSYNEAKLQKTLTDKLGSQINSTLCTTSVQQQQKIDLDRLRRETYPFWSIFSESIHFYCPQRKVFLSKFNLQFDQVIDLVHKEALLDE